MNCLYADPLGTAGHRYQLHVASASQRGMRQNRPLSEIDGGFACGAGARASRATGSPRCLFTGLSRLPPCALRAPVYPVCVPCVSRLPPVSFLPVPGTGTLVGWDACEVRLCDSCVRSPCVSGLSPVSFYRYMDTDDLFTG